MKARKNRVNRNLLNLVKLSVLFALTCWAMVPLRVSASVSISSFDAKWQGNQVVVSWVTGNELNNAGFYVLRSSTEDGTYTKVNQDLKPTQCIACAGGASYSFSDTSVTVGQTYYYKLQSVEFSGATREYGPVKAAPSATATPTATKVPPTSTRTSTSVPVTATFTPVPSSTPTITPTYPPGVTPPTSQPTATPTFTSAPQPTPTRTQTYPPGVKPPTPKPSTATPLPVVAAVPPDSTPVRPAQNSAVATVPNNDSISADGALSSADTTVPPDENADSATGTTTMDQNSSDNTWFRLAILAISGMLGVGALVFGALAIYLFVRFSQNGS